MIEDPEAPHAHAHKSGVQWLDLSLALAVIALSVASLITAQHTGRTMERLVNENSRLVRANATPLLQFTTGNVGDAGQRELSFTVANVGTGTARVIWFELANHGKRMQNIRELIDYVPKASDRDYVMYSNVADTYFPASEQRVIMAWKLPSAPQSLAAWNRLDRGDRFSLVASACFCSVLGECWTSHLRADVPRAVKGCDARGRINFSG